MLFFYGSFYLMASLCIDLGGVAFIAGLAMFLARRRRGGSPRLLSAWWVATLAWLLLAIGLTGFLLEAAQGGAEIGDRLMPVFSGDVTLRRQP